MAINLWPWREEQQDRKRRIFFCVLIAVIAANIALIISVKLFLDRSIKAEQAGIAYLKRQIESFPSLNQTQNFKNEQKKLLEKINRARQRMKFYRHVVATMMLITASVPDGIKINSLTMVNGLWTLHGIATEAEKIAHYTHQLSQLRALKKIRLIQVEQDKKELGNDFIIEAGMSRAGA